LGAGSGYQASLLAARGCDVTALDIATHPPDRSTYFPVQEYDGRTIPLPDSSVDVVFSSHVLEHVDSMPPLLGEMRRVMRRDAIAIHVVPSSTWRIWTSVAHYPFIVESLVFGTPRDSLVNVSSARDATDRFGVLYAISKAIVHPFVAHGSKRNAPAEVWAFGKKRWMGELFAMALKIVSASPTHVFYTGYGDFPRLSLARRRGVSSLLGFCFTCIVLRKAQVVQHQDRRAP
jgi:SAM-dependent methyltransferase